MMGRRDEHGREGVERELTCEDVARVTDSLAMFDEHIREVNIMSGREIVEGEGEDLEVAAEPMGDEDLADETDGDECGPPEDTDMVDEAIEGVVEELESAGYSDEDSEEAVYDAISTLVESGEIDDTPDMDGDEESKALWVKTAVPLIRAKLKEMGLEFESGA